MNIPRAILLTVSFAAAAPFVFPAAAADKKPGNAAREIVFPPPPDKPRIRYLRSLKAAADLKKKKKGLFGKFMESLAGGPVGGPLLKRPYGVAVRNGIVYVADTEDNSVKILDMRKGAVSRLGKGINSQFTTAIAVAVDGKGRAYATDSSENQVKAFDQEGRMLWQVSDLGEGNGRLNRPTGIAWSPKGRVIVADMNNSRVIALSEDGKFVRVIFKKGDEGALPLPANIWVEPDGTILVSDPLSCRVHLFSPEGKFLSGFGEKGDSAGFMSRPRGVASDSEGNIYVVDALFNQVQMFNRKGELLMFFGGHGGDPGAFLLPAGISIDAEDRIYVVDSINRRIQIFQYIKYPKK